MRRPSVFAELRVFRCLMPSSGASRNGYGVSTSMWTHEEVCELDGRENETGSVIAELFLHVPMRWRVLVFVKGYSEAPAVWS